MSYQVNRKISSIGTRTGIHNYFQSQLYYYPTHHPFSAYQHPTPGAPPLHQMGLLALVCITNVDE